MQFLKPSVLFATLVILAGCGKSYTYNYRLTVTVQDGDKQITASHVVRVTERPTSRKTEGVPSLCGSALQVPLSGGRFLFVLLKGSRLNGGFDASQMIYWRGSPTRILLAGYGLPTEWAREDDSGIGKLPLHNQPLELSPMQLPEMITFARLTDPRSVKEVNPENMEKSLGGNIGLVRAFIQSTNDAVSPGNIRELLPWFSPNKEYLDGSRLGFRVNGYKSGELSHCGWLDAFL